MAKKLLTKDAIFGADDLAFEDVPCPEWGGPVRIGMMTGEERDAYDAYCYQGNRKNFRAVLVAFCARDDTGGRLFTLYDEEGQFTTEDIDRLGAKSGDALNRCVEACFRLNALMEKDVKELEGNS